MFKVFLFSVITTLLILTQPCHANVPVFNQQQQRICGKHCSFAPCRRTEVLHFTTPNSPAPSQICRIDRDLTQVVEVKEALITSLNFNAKDVPISKWRPQGLDVPFPRDFFYFDQSTKRNDPYMFRRHSRGTQHSFLSGLCVVMPVLKYQYKTKQGPLETVNTNDERDCIMFNVLVSDIVIEAAWNSGDDMDLSVLEPKGTLIDHQHKRPGCAFLAYDSNVDGCHISNRGLERIIFERPCLPQSDDKFKALLRHGVNCRSGPTAWELRLIVDGVHKKVIRGTSNKDNNEIVASLEFRLDIYK